MREKREARRAMQKLKAKWPTNGWAQGGSLKAKKAKAQYFKRKNLT